MIINSLWHNKNNTSSIWNEYKTTYLNDFIYVNTLFSLISVGTELTVSTGSVAPGSYSRMKVPYMDGAFDLPIKYGYNLIGRKKEGLEVVHCMHPHQSVCVIRPTDCHRVPDGIPERRATLFGTMETVINAIWDANIDELFQEKILVTGTGLIGMTLALTLRYILNCDVYIHEINPFRKELAIAQNLKIDHGGPYAICFHCSGTDNGLQHAIDHVGYEGTVIELSWYGNRSVSIQLGDSFHYDRKKIISSQVSKIPSHMKTKWNFESRRSLAWEYLKHSCYDSIFTHEIPFEESPQFFAELRKGRRDFVGCLLNYE